MKLPKIYLAIILSAISSSTIAQNCPQGIPSAGNPFCIPPNDPRLPYGVNSAASARQWILTWGAVAMSANGDTGVSVGKLKEKDAIAEALRQCTTWGASDCVLRMAYHNQCVVIVNSDSNLSVVRGGQTIDDAAEGALNSCSKKNDKHGCKVVYSECTRPVLSD